MMEQVEATNSGVVCLHCGLQTPLPGVASGTAGEKRRLSLVRCTECGKEALYLEHEIVILRRISNALLYAA
jgi:DNA-directed RNA polymerase subunit RPC12/RpoP